MEDTITREEADALLNYVKKHGPIAFNLDAEGLKWCCDASPTQEGRRAALALLLEAKSRHIRNLVGISNVVEGI